MGIETYTPAQMAAYLRGQELRPRTLQVSGQTQLDGGLQVAGDATVSRQLNARRLAVTPDSLYEPGSVWQEIVLPNPPNAVGLSNIGVHIANIPQNYRVCIIDFQAVFDAASGVGYLTINFNGDNNANRYFWERLSWAAGAATAIDSSGVFTTSGAVGFAVEGQNAYSEGTTRIVLPNYAHTDHAGHNFFSQGAWILSSAAGNYGGYAFGGGWASLGVQGINTVDLGYSAGGHFPISGKVTVRLLGGLPVA